MFSRQSKGEGYALGWVLRPAAASQNHNFSGSAEGGYTGRSDASDDKLGKELAAGATATAGNTVTDNGATKYITGKATATAANMPGLKSAYTLCMETEYALKGGSGSDASCREEVGKWEFRTGEWPLLSLPEVVTQYWDGVIEEPTKPTNYDD